MFRKWSETKPVLPDASIDQEALPEFVEYVLRNGETRLEYPVSSNLYVN